MEVEWLKKNLPSSVAKRRRLIDESHGELSVSRQCELLSLPRSTWYYEGCGESEVNLELMRRIDALYTKRPFFGSRKVAEVLSVNRK